MVLSPTSPTEAPTQGAAAPSSALAQFEAAAEHLAIEGQVDQHNAHEIRARRRAEAEGISRRLAAHVIAVERVAEAQHLRGLYP